MMSPQGSEANWERVLTLACSPSPRCVSRPLPSALGHSLQFCFAPEQEVSGVFWFCSVEVGNVNCYFLMFSVCLSELAVLPQSHCFWFAMDLDAVRVVCYKGDWVMV